MDKLITALAPVFAAGLGIQQLGELLSPVIDKISADYKKIVLGLVSLIMGLAVAFIANLHVLQLLGASRPERLSVDVFNAIDAIVTGLIVSGGTEGINSILKFLKYTKEDKKNEAAAKTPANANAAAGVATPEALTAMSKK